VGAEGEHHGGLGLSGVGASSLDLGALVESSVVLWEASGVGDGAPDLLVWVVHDGEPGGDVDPGGVAAVGVVDEDAPESVADEAVCDVEGVVEERLALDVDASGEVCVVGAVAVGAGGHEEDVVWDALRGSPGDLLGDGDVGVDGEVVAVVLQGGCGDEDDPVLLSGLPDLVPGQFVVHVLLGGHLLPGRCF